MALTSFDKKYLDQLGLVLEILPWIAREGSFALKGGTAINLFERGLPRLSVDIDLCYPRVSERGEALSKIASALDSLKHTLSEKLHMLEVVRGTSPSQEYKLLCRMPGASVKIEVNTTMRGCAWPLRNMPIHSKAEEILERYIEMPVISKEELFGGKICAALDRQHPRDMFDVHPLVTEEGLNRSVIQGFVVCLICHNRPIYELLTPNELDMKDTFSSQFSGMSGIPFTYSDYIATRSKLFYAILKSLSEKDRRFLISFKKGEPDWKLLGVEGASKLPAVHWKLQNIRRLIEISPRKHRDHLEKLQVILLTSCPQVIAL
ncbi:MAG: nucleotidyl transferase AbiEii/AbiGii toxin family protein [Synergistaceae bacterium]|jgi:hypothetical protein|nr:nucleotidyl transferase AbiEii/AbiGii toxin family protein [Synergistaceae bacterium]